MCLQHEVAFAWPILRMAPCFSLATSAAGHDAAASRAFLFIVPIHRGHFSSGIGLLSSLLRHGSDVSVASLRFVASDTAEQAELSTRLKNHTRSCGSSSQADNSLDVGIATLANVMMPWGVSPVMLEANTSQWGDYWAPVSRNKYHFQFTKKLYAARYFEYTLGLIIDADSVALPRSFSIQGLFEDYLSEPLALTFEGATKLHCSDLWRESPLSPSPAKGNASVPDWPSAYNWFVFKDVMEAMFADVEGRFNMSFYAATGDIFRNRRAGRCYEHTTYMQFLLLSPTHRARIKRLQSWNDVYRRALPDESALWGVPPSSDYTSRLMPSRKRQLNGTNVSVPEQVASGLTVLVRELRLGIFRLPNEVAEGAKGRAWCRWRMACGQAYFQTLRRLFASCSTLKFAMGHGAWIYGVVPEAHA